MLCCSIKEKLRISVPEDYTKWKSNHICKKNHTGSSGSMEVNGAKRIMSRSFAMHKLRYTDFYGDGDSKRSPCYQKYLYIRVA